MSSQALGVVTDTRIVTLTPTEADWKKWVLLGSVAIFALLFVSRGREKVIVVKG